MYTTATAPTARLTDVFERVYIVNLPERRDRRRAITRELKLVDLALSPGQVEVFPAIRPEHPGEFPSIGARGCFLSHLAILRQAHQDGLASVLVLEDDLQFSRRLKREQAAVVRLLQETAWDMAYLGLLRPATPDAALALEPQLPTQPIMRTHFYGMQQRLFTPMIEFLELLLQRPSGHPAGGPMHIDGAFSTFRERYPQWRTVVATPSLGWQRSSRSDLWPVWYDRVPGVQQLSTALRVGKAWLDEWRLG